MFYRAVWRALLAHLPKYAIALFVAVALAAAALADPAPTVVPDMLQKVNDLRAQNGLPP